MGIGFRSAGKFAAAPAHLSFAKVGHPCSCFADRKRQALPARTQSLATSGENGPAMNCCPLHEEPHTGCPTFTAQRLKVGFCHREPSHSVCSTFITQ